jgi:hypothetical protein
MVSGGIEKLSRYRKKILQTIYVINQTSIVPAFNLSYYARIISYCDDVDTVT